MVVISFYIRLNMPVYRYGLCYTAPSVVYMYIQARENLGSSKKTKKIVFLRDCILRAVCGQHYNSFFVVPMNNKKVPL